MGKDMHDMRRLRIDETTTTAENREISDAATRYYNTLFDHYPRDNIKGSDMIGEMRKHQWDF